MSKLRLGVAALIVAAIAAVFPSPASAHTSAGAGVFVGTASVGGGSVQNGGLFLPAALPCGGVCPLENHGWSFSSNILDVIVSSDIALIGAGTGRISGNGTLQGYCGGSIGTGNATVGSESGAVTFVTVGGTGVLVGTAPVILATFQARPLPTAGGVPCVTEGAVQFLVAGAGAVVAAA